MTGSLQQLSFRPVGPDESLDTIFDLADLAFHETTSPAHRDRLNQVIDREETLCAHDDGRPVGCSVVFPQTLSVPGAQLACGAFSWVAVAPTHRRRGILRTMMEGQLARLIAADTPLAALYASEATIYGRFGFGIASSAHSYDIRARERDSGLRDGAAGLGVALIETHAARDVLSDIYHRAGAQRAGMLGRDASWWTHQVLADLDDDPHAGPLSVITAGDPAEGYAIYRVSADETLPHAQDALVVRELVAATSEAARALWSYLLSVDLVGRVSAPLRPVDDPLTLLLANRRTADRREIDGLWLRLLDVPRALESRRWSAPFELVLEIEDDLVTANAGRWQLSNQDDRPRCVRSDRPADLVLPVAQLGAVYLGGGSLIQARDAGLIEELTPGAAAWFDQAARTDRAPWNVSGF